VAVDDFDPATQMEMVAAWVGAKVPDVSPRVTTIPSGARKGVDGVLLDVWDSRPGIWATHIAAWPDGSRWRCQTIYTEDNGVVQGVSDERLLGRSAKDVPMLLVQDCATQMRIYSDGLLSGSNATDRGELPEKLRPLFGVYRQWSDHLQSVAEQMSALAAADRRVEDTNMRLACLAIELERVVPEMDPRWTKWMLQLGLPNDLTALDAFEGAPEAEVPRLRFYFHPTGEVWHCAHITWDPLIDSPRSLLATFDRECSDGEAAAWALCVVSDSLSEWARIVLERDRPGNGDPEMLTEVDRLVFRRLERIAIDLERLARGLGFQGE
jgi:hypothetical protein